MPENRTDRTDFLKLLALMAESIGSGPGADSKDWSFPYWNQIIVDAQIAALHDATRDGLTPITAPDDAVTLALVASGGYLPAGQTWEVVQTFVDEYGRETNPSTVESLSTGTATVDPSTAPTLGNLTSGATGFGGGLLEVWYAWFDSVGGETLYSPSETVEIPYLSGGLLTEVDVTLPATPASVGAAGANVYIQHRETGNIVLAAATTADTQTVITLDGTILSCYQTLPTLNTTGAGKVIQITGDAANAGESPTLTRFYVRLTGEDWDTADRRLYYDGADEWDPATVSYPLLFDGSVASLVPGYPPESTLVKSIRPIDISTETIGTLDEADVSALIARDLEVAALLGGPYVLTGLVVAAQASPDMTVQVTTGWAISDERIWNPAADSSVGIDTAHATLDRIDIVCVNASGAIVSSAEDASCKGTAAASPVAPSTPAHYVLLATISIPAADTTIGAGQITDARYLPGSLADISDGYQADDLVIQGNLDDHEADTVAHSSKAFTMTEATTTCSASSTSDFTIPSMKSCLVTQMKATASSGSPLAYILQIFSDSGRTVLEYQIGDTGTEVDYSPAKDRIPWEWFGGATAYCRLTNNGAGDITSFGVELKYRY